MADILFERISSIFPDSFKLACDGKILCFSGVWKFNRIDLTESGCQHTLAAGAAGSHREQRRRNRGCNQKIGRPLQFTERQLVQTQSQKEDSGSHQWHLQVARWRAREWDHQGQEEDAAAAAGPSQYIFFTSNSRLAITRLY